MTLRIFLLTVAIAAALMAAGLVWGWHIGVLDDPAWRADAPAWGWLSLALFAASCHPLPDWLSAARRRYGAWSQ